jgi:hypothetical protein
VWRVVLGQITSGVVVVVVVVYVSVWASPGDVK